MRNNRTKYYVYLQDRSIRQDPRRSRTVRGVTALTRIPEQPELLNRGRGRDMRLVIRLTMTQRPPSVEHRSFTGVEVPTSTSQPLQPTRSFTYSALQALSRNHALTSTKFLNAKPCHPNTRQIR